LFTGICGTVMIVLFTQATWSTARRLAAEEPSRNGEWRARH